MKSQRLILADGKAPCLLHGQQPLSRPAINVFNLVCRAMVATLVVSLLGNTIVLPLTRFPKAKCVSRKCRCTYVKFHRQTAPMGPGHTRPTAPADVASGSSLPSAGFSNEGLSPRLPLYQHSDDEFVLGPAPGSVPTMAETLYGSNSFTFPPLYPPNTDLSHISDNLDYGAKYRTQQAEIFGPSRSGLTPLYDPRHGTSTPNPPWLGWESQDSPDVFHHSQHQGHRQVEIMLHHSPSSAMHGNHIRFPSPRYT
jgi:hypothetical protein